MPPEFITVGKILAPSGITGKLKVEVLTDFPQRFAPCSKVYIDRQPATIESTEWHKGKTTIKLDTVNSIEDTQRLPIDGPLFHPFQTRVRSA